MPGYKTHLAGGAITYAIFVCLCSGWLQLSPSTALYGFFCTLLGALFPDFDTKSRGQTLIYRFLVPVLLVLIVQQKFKLFILVTCVSFIPLVVKHRGLLHKSWFIIAGSCVVACLLAQFSGAQLPVYLRYACFFSLGALSHIFLDFKKFW